jgi:uncharacterized protein with ATP-grasp and redox domains
MIILNPLSFLYAPNSPRGLPRNLAAFNFMKNESSLINFKTSVIRRAISFLLILVFVITDQSVNFAHANTVSIPKPALNLPQDLNTLSLPESLGRIQETFDGSSDKTVILIQDAHAIAEVQLHIQKAIEYFQKEYGISLVALEGAASTLETQIFKSFPDQERVKKVFEAYLKNGELAGSVAAAIYNKTPAQYQGIENWDLYQEAIKLYLEAATQEKPILEKISSLKRDLELQKKLVYSKKLFIVDQLVEKFDSNHAEFGTVLTQLAAIKAPKKGSELALVIEELQKDSLKHSSMDREIKKIAARIKKILGKSPALLSDFNRHNQEFQTSQISPEAFALYLQQVAVENKLSVKTSDELSQLIKRQKRLKNIEGSKLFADVKFYIQSVKESLFRNEAERQLDQKGERLKLIEKLAKLELSREEWETLKFVDRGSWVVDREKLKSNVAFYENAEKRDEAFFRNLTKLLSKRSHSAIRIPQSAMLIAGGFHTAGLTKRFKNAGISYVLITPQINHIPEKSLYRDHMRGDVSWKNYFEVENGKVDLYKAFVRAMRDQLLGQGSAERIAHSVKETGAFDAMRLPLSAMLLKRWRDQIIRDLAEQEKITRVGIYTPFLDEVIKKTNPSARKPWVIKVDRFLESLRKLESKGELNQPNILKILKPAMAVDPTAVASAAHGDLIKDWLVANHNVDGASITGSPLLEARPEAPRVSDLVRYVDRFDLDKVLGLTGSNSRNEVRVIDVERAVRRLIEDIESNQAERDRWRSRGEKANESGVESEAYESEVRSVEDQTRKLFDDLRNAKKVLAAMSKAPSSIVTDDAKKRLQALTREIQGILDSRVKPNAISLPIDDGVYLPNEPQVREEIEHLVVARLGRFSERARNAFAQLGIIYIGDLLDRTADDLSEAHNFGISTLNEVREKLKERDLYLKNENPRAEARQNADLSEIIDNDSAVPFVRRWFSRIRILDISVLILTLSMMLYGYLNLPEKNKFAQNPAAEKIEEKSIPDEIMKWTDESTLAINYIDRFVHEDPSRVARDLKEDKKVTLAVREKLVMMYRENLERATRDSSGPDKVRVPAGDRLRVLGRGIPFLVEVLRDVIENSQHLDYQIEAVKLVAKVAKKNPQDADYLIEIASKKGQDGNASLRLEASLELTSFNDPKIDAKLVEAYISNLESPIDVIRLFSAQALGNFNYGYQDLRQKARSALLVRFPDEKLDSSVQEAFAYALKRMEQQDLDKLILDKLPEGAKATSHPAIFYKIEVVENLRGSGPYKTLTVFRKGVGNQYSSLRVLSEYDLVSPESEAGKDKLYVSPKGDILVYGYRVNYTQAIHFGASPFLINHIAVQKLSPGFGVRDYVNRGALKNVKFTDDGIDIETSAETIHFNPKEDFRFTRDPRAESRSGLVSQLTPIDEIENVESMIRDVLRKIQGPILEHTQGDFGASSFKFETGHGYYEVILRNRSLFIKSWDPGLSRIKPKESYALTKRGLKYPGENRYVRFPFSELYQDILLALHDRFPQDANVSQVLYQNSQDSIQNKKLIITALSGVLVFAVVSILSLIAHIIYSHSKPAKSVEPPPAATSRSEARRFETESTLKLIASMTEGKADEAIVRADYGQKDLIERAKEPKKIIGFNIGLGQTALKLALAKKAFPAERKDEISKEFDRAMDWLKGEASILKLTPPQLGAVVYDIVAQITGDSDPHSEQDDRNVAGFETIYPFLEKKLKIDKLAPSAELNEAAKTALFRALIYTAIARATDTTFFALRKPVEAIVGDLGISSESVAFDDRPSVSKYLDFVAFELQKSQLHDWDLPWNHDDSVEVKLFKLGVWRVEKDPKVKISDRDPFDAWLSSLKTKTIVIRTDDKEDLVIGKLEIKILLLSGFKVVVAGPASPIMNDATAEWLSQYLSQPEHGLQSFIKSGKLAVISTGTRSGATDFLHTSEEFNRAVFEAQAVISEGSTNAESLFNAGVKVPVLAALATGKQGLQIEFRYNPARPEVRVDSGDVIRNMALFIDFIDSMRSGQIWRHSPQIYIQNYAEARAIALGYARQGIPYDVSASRVQKAVLGGITNPIDLESINYRISVTRRSEARRLEAADFEGIVLKVNKLADFKTSFKQLYRALYFTEPLKTNSFFLGIKAAWNERQGNYLEAADLRMKEAAHIIREGWLAYKVQPGQISQRLQYVLRQAASDYAFADKENEFDNVITLSWDPDAVVSILTQKPQYLRLPEAEDMYGWNNVAIQIFFLIQKGFEKIISLANLKNWKFRFVSPFEVTLDQAGYEKIAHTGDVTKMEFFVLRLLASWGLELNPDYDKEGLKALVGFAPWYTLKVKGIANPLPGRLTEVRPFAAFEELKTKEWVRLKGQTKPVTPEDVINEDHQALAREVNVDSEGYEKVAATGDREAVMTFIERVIEELLNKELVNRYKLKGFAPYYTNDIDRNLDYHNFEKLKEELAGADWIVDRASRAETRKSIEEIAVQIAEDFHIERIQSAWDIAKGRRGAAVGQDLIDLHLLKGLKVVPTDVLKILERALELKQKTLRDNLIAMPSGVEGYVLKITPLIRDRGVKVIIEMPGSPRFEKVYSPEDIGLKGLKSSISWLNWYAQKKPLRLGLKTAFSAGDINVLNLIAGFFVGGLIGWIAPYVSPSSGATVGLILTTLFAFFGAWKNQNDFTEPSSVELYVLRQVLQSTLQRFIDRDSSPRVFISRAEVHEKQSGALTLVDLREILVLVRKEYLKNHVDEHQHKIQTTWTHLAKALSEWKGTAGQTLSIRELQWWIANSDNTNKKLHSDSVHKLLADSGEIIIKALQAEESLDYLMKMFLSKLERDFIRRTVILADPKGRRGINFTPKTKMLVVEREDSRIFPEEEFALPSGEGFSNEIDAVTSDEAGISYRTGSSDEFELVREGRRNRPESRKVPGIARLTGLFILLGGVVHSFVPGTQAAAKRPEPPLAPPSKQIQKSDSKHSESRIATPSSARAEMRAKIKRGKGRPEKDVPRNESVVLTDIEHASALVGIQELARVAPSGSDLAGEARYLAGRLSSNRWTMDEVRAALDLLFQNRQHLKASVLRQLGFPHDRAEEGAEETLRKIVETQFGNSRQSLTENIRTRAETGKPRNETRSVSSDVQAEIRRVLDADDVGDKLSLEQIADLNRFLELDYLGHRSLGESRAIIKTYDQGVGILHGSATHVQNLIDEAKNLLTRARQLPLGQKLNSHDLRHLNGMILKHAKGKIIDGEALRRLEGILKPRRAESRDISIAKYPGLLIALGGLIPFFIPSPVEAKVPVTFPPTAVAPLTPLKSDPKVAAKDAALSDAADEIVVKWAKQEGYNVAASTISTIATTDVDDFEPYVVRATFAQLAQEDIRDGNAIANYVARIGKIDKTTVFQFTISQNDIEQMGKNVDAVMTKLGKDADTYVAMNNHIIIRFSYPEGFKPRFPAPNQQGNYHVVAEAQENATVYVNTTGFNYQTYVNAAANFTVANSASERKEKQETLVLSDQLANRQKYDFSKPETVSSLLAALLVEGAGLSEDAFRALVRAETDNTFRVPNEERLFVYGSVAYAVQNRLLGTLKAQSAA